MLRQPPTFQMLSWGLACRLLLLEVKGQLQVLKVLTLSILKQEVALVGVCQAPTRPAREVVEVILPVQVAPQWFSAVSEVLLVV